MRAFSTIMMSAALRAAVAIAAILVSACSAPTRPRDDAASDGDADTDVNTDADADTDGAPPHLPAEPTRGTCWTATPVDGALAILEIDLQTRSWRDLGRRGEGFAVCLDASSLAVSQGALLLARRRSPFAVDLETGATTEGDDDLRYQGLGGRGSELVRMADMEGVGLRLAVFRDPESVLAHDPSELVPITVDGDRLGFADGRAYVTDYNPRGPRTLSVVDGHSGALLSTVELEGAEVPLQGIAVADGQVLLLTGASPGRLSSFDLETGRLIDSFSISDTPGECGPVGLTCSSTAR